MAGSVRRSKPMSRNTMPSGSPGAQATKAGLALRGQPADVGKRLNGLMGSMPGPNQAAVQPRGSAKVKNTVAGTLKRGSMAGVKSTIDAGNTGPKRGKLNTGKMPKKGRSPSKVGNRIPRGKGVVNPMDMGIS